MSQPTLLVRSGGAAALPEWQAAFARVMPELQVRWWNDASVDKASVDYVLVWEPEPGRIAELTNLRAVFSTAAGVDHIVRDPALPAHLPVVRMGSDEVPQPVAEYVVMGALACLRKLPTTVANQAKRQWVPDHPGRTARETRVGIMGLGRIGLAAAAMLAPIGFLVHGWSRTPRAGGPTPDRRRPRPAVPCHAAREWSNSGRSWAKATSSSACCRTRRKRQGCWTPRAWPCCRRRREW